MLGPVLDTYKPNVRMIFIIVALGFVFCTPLFYVTTETTSPVAQLIFFAVLAFFLLLLAERLTARAYLHENGISYRSIFSHKEMRWQEIERLYYGSHLLSGHAVILGTFYRLLLRDQNGQKLSLGDRVRRVPQLAEKIAQFTYQPLLRNATDAFHRGDVLD